MVAVNKETKMSIEINGSAFTVVRRSENMIHLAGKRGAEHVLVRNVHSGNWAFLRGGVKEEKIHTIAGL